MTDSEFGVDWETALERLAVEPEYDDGGGPRPCVHTFLNPGGMLMGAHWPLTDVQRAAERYGVEEAGDQAAAMGHGLVIVRPTGPVFLATKQVPA